MALVLVRVVLLGTRILPGNSFLLCGLVCLFVYCDFHAVLWCFGMISYCNIITIYTLSRRRVCACGATSYSSQWPTVVSGRGTDRFEAVTRDKLILAEDLHLEDVPRTRQAPVPKGSVFRSWKFHTFSAFWLRSSVVSVLISLISDTVYLRVAQLINLIFWACWGSPLLAKALDTRGLCIALQQRAAG